MSNSFHADACADARHTCTCDVDARALREPDTPFKVLISIELSSRHFFKIPEAHPNPVNGGMAWNSPRSRDNAGPGASGSAGSPGGGGLRKLCSGNMDRPALLKLKPK